METSKTKSQLLLQKIKGTRFFKPWAFIILFAVVGASILFFVHAATMQEFKLYDAQARGSLSHLGHNKVMDRGNVTGYLYNANVRDVKAYFHDNSTGQSTNLRLGSVYSNAPDFAGNPFDYVWTSNNTIITISQDPSSITLRRYQLSGSPLPIAATLIGSYSFGDINSRPDAIIQLASGAIVATWHDTRLGSLRNVTAAYWKLGGSSWQILDVPFSSTGSSDSVLVQQPADKSIWIVLDADAYGQLQAAHLTESGGDLHLDWTNYHFIIGDENHLNGPDPEHADLAAAVDPTTGEIVLAYQSADRQIVFYNGGNDAESHPAVARIKADGTITYMPRLPVWVERTAQMGLIVKPGEVWLAYYPLDETNGKFGQLYASQYVNGQWQPQTFLGTSGTTSSGFLQGISRAEFVTTLYDANIVSQVSTFTFETGTIGPSPPSDTTAPTANITTPLNGNTISGTVNVTATAGDNGVLADVKLYLDGNTFLGNLYNATSRTFNSVPWDTTKVGNGTHTLVAKAYDAAGNEGISATISVTVQNIAPPPPTDTNAPVVQITTPANGTHLKGTSINIVARAQDDVGVTKTELYLDNNLTLSLSGGSLNYTWNIQKLSKGTHIIVVKAYDAANNVGSAQVSVIK